MKDVIIFFLVLLLAFYGLIQIIKKCTLNIINCIRKYKNKNIGKGDSNA